eukprot:2255730-Amphidinium_carterae.1
MVRKVSVCIKHLQVYEKIIVANNMLFTCDVVQKPHIQTCACFARMWTCSVTQDAGVQRYGNLCLGQHQGCWMS